MAWLAKRRVVVAVGVMLSAAAFAQAPAATPPAVPADQRKEITDIEQRIGQANFDCDYKFFAQVEADEFIFTDAAGGITTRSEDLAGEKDIARHARDENVPRRRVDCLYALDGCA